MNTFKRDALHGAWCSGYNTARARLPYDNRFMSAPMVQNYAMGYIVGHKVSRLIHGVTCNKGQ